MVKDNSVGRISSGCTSAARYGTRPAQQTRYVSITGDRGPHLFLSNVCLKITVGGIHAFEGVLSSRSTCLTPITGHNRALRRGPLVSRAAGRPRPVDHEPVRTWRAVSSACADPSVGVAFHRRHRTTASTVESSASRKRGREMAKSLRGLSVFVASPGGLEAERKQFFEILSKFNANDAHESGLSFIPQGHELAYPGAGRPQSLINDQVRSADYCIVVFWDKWGMPTSSGGPYSSGTQEEYEVAVNCLEDASTPMRDVVVLFKGVEDRQMSDPGVQLQRVLDFKKQLERERRILYRTFDTLDEFSDELRRLLSKWTREWSSRHEVGKAPLPPAQTPLPVATPSDVSLLEKAKFAARSGQDTLAHELYTQATTGAYDREAWTEYIRFLRKTGRFSLVQSAGDKMIQRARDLNDHEGTAEALANMGIVKRSQGHRSAAIQYFDRALRELVDWEDQGGPLDRIMPTKAYILDNKGLTWRRMSGRLEDAIAAIQEAIKLHEEIGDVRGQGHALRNMGVVWAQLGSLEASERALRDALDIFRAADDERAMAMTYSALGETLELRGVLAEAIEHFELALEINTSLNNRPGKSMNMSQIARAEIEKGDLEIAKGYAAMCLAAGQESGIPEGLAAGLAVTGRVQLYSGDLEGAHDSLADAQSIYRDLDQPAGLTATSLDLALVLSRRGDTAGARLALRQAEETLDESPHFGLSQLATRVRNELNIE